jgi:uncharacterized protein YdaU (DUF1376 family)
MATGTVDHYMPMFGRDFLASTAGWTAAERGHYFVLLIVQWEQGAIPDGLDRLELVSPGVTAAWAILEPKFPAGDDGLRRNRRLEEHRVKAQELKDARSEAGKRGNDARWDRKRIANGSQSDRKRIANGVANGVANGSPPSPSPNREERQYARAAGVPPVEAAGGSPEPRAVENPGDSPAAGPGAPGNHAAVPGRGRMAAEPGAGNTRRTGEDDWRRPGWVHDEWARIVAAWNSTDRAVPWTLATPPNGFADLAACPGWVETALAAVAMLPDCRRFSRPVPWTQFVRDLDRIIAGEFRDPATERRELAAAGGRQQKRGNMR